MNANKVPGRKDIVVGQLVGRHAGDNPHLWYDPAYVKAAAKAIAAALVAVDPAHKAEYQQGEANFIASLSAVGRKDRRHAQAVRRTAGDGVRAGVWLPGGLDRP